MKGFSVGDHVVEHEHNYGKIVEFKLCKNNNQVMPVITANGRTYFAHWDYLRKTQDLEQLNLFKPLDEGDANEPLEGDFMETQTFKGITIRPPMSEMVKRGIKNIENRTIAYSTKTDGKLAIHAGKTYDPEQAQWIKDNIGIEPPTPEECQMGGIIAIAEVETTLDSESPWAMPDSKYYWNILNIKPIKFFPLRGQQGLFNCEIPIENLENLVEETPNLKLGDWITTTFDYELNLAHIHSETVNQIKRLGTIIKEQSNSFIISSFPNNQTETIIKCEAKLLPLEIIEQLFTLIPQVPTLNLTQELDELEAESKSYLPESYPDTFTIPQNTRLELVNITEIKRDSRTQPRDLDDNKISQKSKTVIEDYAQQKRQGVIFDPIELIETPEGLYLATGHHRLSADIANHELQTWALIKQGTLADAIAIGALANAKQQHFNLTKKEKVNQAYHLFEAFSLLNDNERIERQLQGVLPRNTDGEIASATGLSRNTILNIRKKLIDEHPEDPQWQFLKGGKTLTKNGRIIDTSAIGNPKEEKPFALPIEIEPETPLIPPWLKRGMAVSVLDKDAPDTKGIALNASAIGAPVLFPNQETHYVVIERLQPYIAVGDRMMLDGRDGVVIGIEISEIAPDCTAYFQIDGVNDAIEVRAIDLENIEVIQEADLSILTSQPSEKEDEIEQTDSDKELHRWRNIQGSHLNKTEDEINLSYSDEDVEAYGWQPPNKETEEGLIHNVYTPNELCELLVENKTRLSQAQLQWTITSLISELEPDHLSAIAQMIEKSGAVN
jgi:hypothetical protein